MQIVNLTQREIRFSLQSIVNLKIENLLFFVRRKIKLENGKEDRVGEKKIGCNHVLQVL